MPVWNPISDKRAGYLYHLSDAIRVVETEHADLLTCVRGGNLILASDYSGQHKTATHEAYSFVVTNENYLSNWLPIREKFRATYLPDGRTISFKKLNEKVRWNALPAFLQLAAQLQGNLITVLIDRRVGSLFDENEESTADAFPHQFSERTRHTTREKIIRLSGFVALIISGLRREDQPMLWVSDHDEALDTDERRTQLARLASLVSLRLTGWENPVETYFGTTEMPSSPYWAEDLAGIADVVAGSYCKLSSVLPYVFGDRVVRRVVRSNEVTDRRARAIGNWLVKRPSNLRHVLLRLERDETGNVRSTAQMFKGTA